MALSYPSVARSVERLKKREVYVPLHSAPGEECQVDFGYLGRFRRNGNYSSQCNKEMTLVKILLIIIIFIGSRLDLKSFTKFHYALLLRTVTINITL